MAEPTSRRPKHCDRAPIHAGRALSHVGVLAFGIACLLLLAACDQTSTTTSAPSPVPTAQVGSTTLTHRAATTVPPRIALVPLSTPALPATFTQTWVPTATEQATRTPTTSPRAPSSATPTTSSDSSSGYVFPVQPVARVNYGPYHHDYPAVDIFCPVGSLFVAPTSGIVNYVSTQDKWDPAVDDPATRGGLSVAIIGDDGVRYYGSHLSSVAQGIVPGKRVTSGEALGKTGHSGDARYTEPHLHFGISPPTTPEDWKVRRGVISPYKYLRAWQTGDQLRPVLK